MVKTRIWGRNLVIRGEIIIVIEINDKQYLIMSDIRPFGNIRLNTVTIKLTEIILNIISFILNYIC